MSDRRLNTAQGVTLGLVICLPWWGLFAAFLMWVVSHG